MPYISTPKLIDYLVLCFDNLTTPFGSEMLRSKINSDDSIYYKRINSVYSLAYEREIHLFHICSFDLKETFIAENNACYHFINSDSINLNGKFIFYFDTVEPFRGKTKEGKCSHDNVCLIVKFFG